MRFDLQQKFASLDEPGLKFTGQGVPDIDDSISPNTAIAVLREEFSETFNETLDWSGHRLGGYCNSVQEDMRGDKYRDYALLLQIDSDRENGVMWGEQQRQNQTQITERKQHGLSFRVFSPCRRVLAAFFHLSSKIGRASCRERV